MNKIKKISGYLMIAIFFTSCITTQFVTFSPKPVEKIEAIAFIGILIGGLMYAWKKGALQWI